MTPLPLEKAFLYVESGPVVLVTTFDGKRNNIMTISWTMVKDFDAQFMFLTGPWNYSYKALTRTKECTLAIPTVDIAETVVKIGAHSVTEKRTPAESDGRGSPPDKFEKFGLHSLPAKKIDAPLIKECYVNIECKVTDYLKAHSIFVLQGVHAWIDSRRKEKRLFHAVGDGTFIVDGEKLNYRKIMKDKLPF
jgi:flavin reductase (DIM6/NTAB) family NADH-FMN oxidoreductase RutF